MKLIKRFKNRFCMKPIGEHYYRADFTAHDFRSTVVAVLARKEGEKESERMSKLLKQMH